MKDLLYIKNLIDQSIEFNRLFYKP